MKHSLSHETISIIENSAQLVTQNDTKISLAMYPILFERFPKKKELFVHTPTDKYMKLADALSLYAVNIDKLHILKPALDVIAHEHVRAGVKPGHYPMVGKALILALEEVLGEEATPAFVDAWREAYLYLSEILTEMESKLYEAGGD